MLVLTRRFATRDSPGEEIWIDGGRIRVVAATIISPFLAGLVINGNYWPIGMDEYAEIEPGITLYCDRFDCVSIKLGVTAPKEVAIDREEIHHIKHGTRWGLNEQLRKGKEGRTGSSRSDTHEIRRAG